MIFLNKTYLRMVICFTLILSLFLIASTRIMVINTDEKILAAREQNLITVTISNLRKNIFDTNGYSLTGTKTKIIAVIPPREETLSYCSAVFFGDKKETIMKTLNDNKPAVVEVEEEINCVGVINIEVPLYVSENTLCNHLIGYTDSSWHGVCAINKAYDSYLYTDKKITVKFASDGTGKVLAGIDPIIEEHKEIKSSGIKLTIDTKVQVAAENATKKLNKGAVVISEVGSGKIRAMVSKPTYNPENIEEFLNREDSPLLNRNLVGYNVGSAFKPCVAAAALERKFDGSYLFNCSGSTTIDGNVFACHNLSGHGEMNLGSAIINSCNSYFYNLAVNLGGSSIYEMSTVFGFGYSKTLCNGITTYGENMPSITTLNSSNRALANISIGQGQLLSSPVTLLSLYEAIANGGVYHTPTIIEGFVENGIVTKQCESVCETRAILEETADILKEHLKEVVISGTGKNAFSEKISVAGKTATAQTGWKKDNGKAVQHSWFCGFFPAENPKYVAVVLVEDSEKESVSATEIFRYIAEALTP